MGMNLGEIGNLSGLLKTGGGTPLELDISLIDEDLHQPRKSFDSEKLEELARTIRLRGIKTPISVRVNQKAEGRYIINHGARRVRASRLAGKTTIPAFVDNDYKSEDQLIENIQRDNLTPREIADFIDARLKEGMKKNKIADMIGKSPAYIKQHVVLLDLPEPIAHAFNSERCQDITAINELVTAYKENPDEVTEWLDDETLELNRGSIRQLREYINEIATSGLSENDSKKEEEQSTEDTSRDGKMHKGTEKEQARKEPKIDADKLKKAIIQVELSGRTAQLMLTRRPSSRGLAWFKYDDDGEELEAALEQVKLTAIIEG
jgi:ParB family chromosome partitioning protein